MKPKYLLVPFLLIYFGGNIFGQVPENLDRYIDTVLTVFEVPGISVAVVKDGKNLLTKGYGLKHLGSGATVDKHTLFPIASNTKAFTAMALAILVDDGKVKWDDPVINYMPWFKMSDPWVTAQITIRDLLVHHSGIPAFAGDLLLFPPTTYSRKQILEKVKDIPLIKSFRASYAYDNILYVAAGELIGEVGHLDYEDFIKQRILVKTGMNETVVRFSDLKNFNNLATGHTLIQAKLTPVDEFMEQIIGDAGDPAGGIVSNAVDMAKWMLAELDSGKLPDHNKLLNPSGTDELWKIVTPLPIPILSSSLKPAQPSFYGYALGVRVSNYGKYKIISHGGKLDGFVSHVLLVPELKLGISVLTNQESTGAYWSIIYHLLDYYMHNPSFNWITPYQQLMANAKIEWKKEWDKSVVTKTPGAPNPLIADKYIGSYKDRFYGNVVIAKNPKDKTSLTIQFSQSPQLIGRLEPFQYETFKVIFQNSALKADAYLSFTLAADGAVSSFQLKVIDPSSDITFDELIFKK